MPGGGGIIIIDATKATLSNLDIQACFSSDELTLLAPLLAKDSANWTLADRIIGKHLYGVAMIS